MKRIFVYIIVIVLLLSSCSGKSQKITSGNDVPTLRMLMIKTNENNSDADLVIEKLNEYLIPLIGVQLEMIFIRWEEWEQTVNQILNSNEQLDLLYTSMASLEKLIGQDQLLPLNDLLDQYGQGILNVIDQEYRVIGQVNNIQYATVTNRSMAKSFVFEYRADIAKRYGLDMDHVSSLEDLEKVFNTLRGKSIDITPAAHMQYVIYNHWDSLGDNLGVLMNQGQSRTVENLYETAIYEDYIGRMHKWRERGYLYDTLSTSTTNSAYLRSGNVFGCFANAKPGFDVQETRSIGYPIQFLELISPMMTTDSVGGAMWTIPRNSRDPELAMKMLNLMYTDPTVMNLLTYGIEGTHYVYTDKENNVIDYPPGVDAKNSGYAQFLGWMYGNQFITHVWQGDPPDIWDQMKKFNKNAIRSMALGFTFNSSPVEEEMINCKRIQEKYVLGLENGELDPIQALPAFRRELRNAGVDKIIAEKQTQFNRWLASLEADQ